MSLNMPVHSSADALLPLLKSTFGYDAFRGRQAEVLDRIMAGHNTLAVMPTGAGKSLTYQLPAVALDGCVVVVSPLKIVGGTASPARVLAFVER